MTWWRRSSRTAPAAEVAVQTEAANDGAPALPAADGAERLLRRLEWTVIRRLDGLLQGDYRTLMRGTGLDLADLREYQLHDDVRHIDWNVTARQQVPHVRVFTEDREMAAWFVLDLSRSVDFGSGTRAKRDISAGFVGVLARLLTRHGNRVGALVYGHSLEAVLPPRSGRAHVLRLLHLMGRRAPEDKRAAKAGPAAAGMTKLADLLDAAAALMPRRSTVFVVSDFLSEPGWEKPLGRLAQRHEVVAVRLFDPLELDLPDLGLVPLTDAETGEQLWVDTHDAGFRRRFARLAADRETALREALARAGVDALELSTEDDLVQAIVRFSDLRKRRVRTGRSGPATLPAGAPS
ncbi:DUF58 domain-containing protein [Xenophilus sp. Marseille-Q4582]|uniref:DUF58 domain-containing protein n=1 Tax=Xenophilus sp. Marseille-Q4582 TaxID=2866600 RepID=UPI001CE4B0CC|nr:DUF58 domain-containing protein [Xenophilus sp. Marseille-Q4582]